MIWGFPAAFYFAFAAIPVAAVFFYHRRHRVVEVPAVQIWEKLGNPVETRSFRSLLRKLLTLLVQMLLVALLIFALADPLPDKQAPQRMVVIIDTSYTMQTRERTGRRMDLAKEKALAALTELPAEGEVVVIQAAHCPLLVQPMTRDAQAARQKVSDLEALDVAGDLEGAVRLAKAFVEPNVRCSVKVISDFTAASPSMLKDVWVDPEGIEMMPVGEDHPNAAITWIWSETTSGNTLVHAMVRGYRMSGQAVPVVLKVNGRIAARQQVTLGDSQQQVSFTEPMVENDVFEVALESGDALEADDSAFGVAGSSQNVKMCLVTHGNPPLERALRANDGVDLRVVTADNFVGAADNEIVIVDGETLPQNLPGKAAGYLFVGGADPFGCMQAKGWSNCPKVTHWSSGHPCMLDIDPTVFRVRRALGVTCSPPFVATELIGASSTPLVLEMKGLRSGPPESRPIRCLYWLFRIQETDLPSHLSFPVLLWNALDYLNYGTLATDRNLRITGQPLELLRQSDKLLSVTGPRGQKLDVKTAGDKVVVADTSHRGIYRMAGYRPAAYAVNLLSTQALHPMAADSGATRTAPTVRSGRWERYVGMNWECLILVCAVVGLIEWFLFHRRVLRL
jgi:hypothetical protein